MLRAILPLLLLATPARATDAHYKAYAAGVNVVEVDTRIQIEADRYRVELDFRAVGPLSWLVRSQQRTIVEGRIVNGRAAPAQFYSVGTLRGDPRVTSIHYAGNKPEVRQLVPPNDAEREPVPAEQQAGTVDTLSAMVTLIAQVTATGRCEGRITTFDGRRLAVLEARTEGEQPLEPSSRSSFAGPTLRCAFVGRQLGGFMLSEDRERLTRPQEGTAWFAVTSPGGPRLPVRIAFRTRWWGEATMYLAPPG